MFGANRKHPQNKTHGKTLLHSIQVPASFTILLLPWLLHLNHLQPSYTFINTWCICYICITLYFHQYYLD